MCGSRDCGGRWRRGQGSQGPVDGVIVFACFTEGEEARRNGDDTCWWVWECVIVAKYKSNFTLGVNAGWDELFHMRCYGSGRRADGGGFGGVDCLVGRGGGDGWR